MDELLHCIEALVQYPELYDIPEQKAKREALGRLVEELAKEVKYLEENVFHPSEFEYAGHEDRAQGRITKAMERAGIENG